MQRRSEPDLEAHKTYGIQAMRRILRALPPIERAYATVRFTIMRSKLLTIIDLLLPIEGRILDVGCGFGLFASYFGLSAPGRSILGVDPNARRVGIARKVARELGLEQHEFIEGYAEDPRVQGPFDGIYLLDVLHHVPSDKQQALLEHLTSLLTPHGVLVIKDVTTDPWAQLKFTEVLDRVMVGFDEELAYRHHSEWARRLFDLGFSVRAVRVDDVLPYPHVIVVGQRKG
jgi:2-polyprenyl-3-methyl-5-hydroxy-6-metoxy-1,4-benzoquinol methylase